METDLDTIQDSEIQQLHKRNSLKNNINQQNITESQLNFFLIQNHIKIIDYSKIKLIEVLGEGGQSQVSKGIYKNKEYAIKIISIQPFEFQDIKNELVALNLFKSKYFIQLIGIAYQFQSNNQYLQLYIVMELMDSDLDTFISKGDILSVHQKLGIILQICKGLEEMHGKRIVHRDIKLKNILIKTNKNQNNKIITKLSDFGIIRQQTFKNTEVATFNYCTISYSPPEIMSQNLVSIKGDIWSFGLLVYKLFTNLNPYQENGESKPIALQIIEKKSPFKPSWERIIRIEGIINLIQCCVNVGQPYNKRPLAEDIVFFIEMLIENISDNSNYSPPISPNGFNFSPLKFDSPNEAKKRNTFQNTNIKDNFSLDPQKLQMTNSLKQQSESNQQQEIQHQKPSLKEEYNISKNLEQQQQLWQQQNQKVQIKYRKALQNYNNSRLNNWQENEEYFNNYEKGKQYLLNQKYNEAINNFKECIRLSPLNIQAYNPLGKSYIETSDLQQAENIYNKALNLENDNLQARLGLGLVYYLQDKQSKEYINQFNIVFNNQESPNKNSVRDYSQLFVSLNMENYESQLQQAYKQWKSKNNA